MNVSRTGHKRLTRGKFVEDEELYCDNSEKIQEDSLQGVCIENIEGGGKRSTLKIISSIAPWSE